MRIDRDHPAPKSLLVATLIIVAAGILGGAYAWWGWGFLVALDTVVKFCL